MPELPEVETVRRILEPYVKGKRIAKIAVYRPKNVLTSLEEFVSLPVGKEILGVKRKGKVLCFCLADGLSIYSHLRMEGRYFESKPDDAIGKYELVRYVFSDGTALSYCDTRKFGVFSLGKEGERSPFDELGKEPFDLTPEELHEGLRNRSGTIKEALLDQSLIAGIGNIYDVEVLFDCKIHPKTPAKSLSFSQCEAILLSSRRILNEAIEEGGSTIRSYHPKEGMDGNMQNELKAYGKQSTPCPVCGFPLRRIFIGGRGTTYCPKCVRDDRFPFVVGVTGPIHSGKSAVSRYLESKGYLRFDADTVAKNLYRLSEVKKKAKALFGKEAIVDGKPNASYLANAMAANPKKKAEFQAFLYPLVKKKAEELIASAPKGSKIVLDVPLLLPSHIDELCDAIILVKADESLRLSRLEQEGKDGKLSLKLNARYPLKSTEQKAAFVLRNDGSLEGLYQSIDGLKLP